MKVHVNLRAHGKSVDDIIGEKLAERGLPSCFGKLGMPIVREVVEFESSEIFRLYDEVPDSEVFDKNIEKYVIEERERALLSNMVLTKVGVEKLERYKEQLAEIVVNSLHNCSKCSYIDACDRITKSYLYTLFLHLYNKV